MRIPVPRDRDECSICLHLRDSHAEDCIFHTHEIDVRWLRDNLKESQNGTG